MEIARVGLRRLLLLVSVVTLSFVSVCVDAHVNYIPSQGWETCLLPQANMGEGVAMCEELKLFVSNDLYWNTELIDIPEHDASLKFLCTHNPSADEILQRVNTHVRASLSRQDEYDGDCKKLNNGAVYSNCNDQTVWKYKRALKSLGSVDKTFQPVLVAGKKFTTAPSCTSICHKVTHAIDVAMRRSQTGTFSFASYTSRFSRLDCNQVMTGALAHSDWLEKEDSQDASLTFENVLTGAKQSDLPMIGHVYQFPATVKRLQTCNILADNIMHTVVHGTFLDVIHKKAAVTFTTNFLFKDSVDCNGIVSSRVLQMGPALFKLNGGWKDRCHHVAAALKRFYDSHEDEWRSLETQLITLRDSRSDKFKQQVAVTDVLTDRCRLIFDEIRGGVVPRDTTALRRKCNQNYLQICASLKQEFRLTDVQAQIISAVSENPFHCRYPKDDACELDCQQVSTAMSSNLQPIPTSLGVHDFRSSEYYRTVNSIDCNRIKDFFEERTWEEHEELLNGELTTFYYNRATHAKQYNTPDTRAPLLFQKCKLSAPVICGQIADLFQTIAYEVDGSQSGSCDMRLLKIGLGKRGLDDPSCFDRCELLNKHYKWQDDILNRLQSLVKPRPSTVEEDEKIKILETERKTLHEKRATVDAEKVWIFKSKAKALAKVDTKIRELTNRINSLRQSTLGISGVGSHFALGLSMMDSRRIEATKFKKQFCNLHENGSPAPVGNIEPYSVAFSDNSVRSSGHSTIPGLSTLSASNSEYSGLEDPDTEDSGIESPPSYKQVLRTPPGSVVSTTDLSTEAPSRFDSSLDSSLDDSTRTGDSTEGSAKGSKPVVPLPPVLYTPPMIEHQFKPFFG